MKPREMIVMLFTLRQKKSSDEIDSQANELSII